MENVQKFQNMERALSQNYQAIIKKAGTGENLGRDLDPECLELSPKPPHEQSCAHHGSFIAKLEENKDAFLNQSQDFSERGREDLKLQFTFDVIASKLLQEKYYLTALELHTELLEHGLDLPRLRDYFSNPSNFENQLSLKPNSSSPMKSDSFTRLPRSSSITTFDSIDFTRYSDDGDRIADERVAVLEFELRKAQETIRSLRTNLTHAAESAATTPEAETTALCEEEKMKPHEKRAINFLVNEHLLKNNYKLTSITFADENEDQDFDDWDDVGLNVPRPADLLHIYREYHRAVGGNAADGEGGGRTAGVAEAPGEAARCHAAVMTDQPSSCCLLLHREVNSLIEKLAEAEETIDFLESKHAACQKQVEESMKHRLENNEDNESTELSRSNTRLEKSSSNCVENFEDKKHELVPTDNSEKADGQRRNEPDVQVQNISWETKQSVWAKYGKKFHERLQKTLKQGISPHASDTEGRLAYEVSVVPDNADEAILSWARCLPHIVPNVLLAKREELVPVIISTACLHPDSKERDRLLNILFNLIKKPDEKQREIILTGCEKFAEKVGFQTVESELLPQCWEQISHKLPERRLLVTEACASLAPYISRDMCSSLVFSILQQIMSDDTDDAVRAGAVRSFASLLAYISDPDKYPLVKELLLCGLGDQCQAVSAASDAFLLPSVAWWTMNVDRLMLFADDILARREDGSGFVPKILRRCMPFLFAYIVINGPFHQPDRSAEKGQDICDNESVKQSNTSEHTNITDRTCPQVGRIPCALSALEDLGVLLAENVDQPECRGDALNLVTAYDNYVAREWFDPWPSFVWAADELLPALIKRAAELDLGDSTVVKEMCSCFMALCQYFGKTFVELKVKPLFEAALRVEEESLDSEVIAGKTPLTTGLVPVYLAGVIASHHTEEDRREMENFLQNLLQTISLCRASLDSLSSAFAQLGACAVYHECLLSVLWASVMHKRAAVRCTVATMFGQVVAALAEPLVAGRVMPALVTLASDSELAVRQATVAALGRTLEACQYSPVVEKGRMQLESLLEDDHAVKVEVVRTFSRLAPNSDPRFRDEFMLPKLAELAAANTQTKSDSKRVDLALALFEAYSSLACCFMTDHAIVELLLPGLKALDKDLPAEHHQVVASMVRDFDSKVEAFRTRSESQLSASSVQSTLSASSGHPEGGGLAEGSPNIKSFIHNFRETNTPTKLKNMFQKTKK